MKRFSLAVVVRLVLVVGVLGSPLTPTAVAASPERPPAQRQTDPEREAAFATLQARTGQAGSVRVLVTLNTAFAPEADLSAAEVDTQRAQILAARVALDRALSFAGRDALTFERLPVVVLTVSGEDLEILRQSPWVASIQEDAPEFSTLAQSTALVGTAGSFGVNALGFTGAGYSVAVLDVGVDRFHPFLQGRVIGEACFSSTQPVTSGNVVVGQATTTCANGTNTMIGLDAGRPCSIDNPDPLNACSHGTHVAGIAAGAAYADMIGDGAGGTYSGVAPGAGILAVQVFSRIDGAFCGAVQASPCYATFPSDQLRALDWLRGVVTTYNLAAVNMSLGGTTKFTSPCDTDSRKPAIDQLRSLNVPVVIAAGNSGFTNGLSAPACISSAISVGATTDSSPVDQVASFSNSASFLSLLAPGTSIVSAVPNRQFAAKPGTSMAAPHVAGAFAILRQVYPTDTVDQALARLTANGVLVTDSRNGITKPRLFLPNAVPSVAFTPADAGAFGMVTLDLSSDRVFTLRNGSSFTLSLSSQTVTGAGVTFSGGSYPGNGGTCGATLVAQSSCTIRLTYAPTAPGVLDGELRVTFSPSIAGASVASIRLGGSAQPLCTSNQLTGSVLEQPAGWSQTGTASVLPIRTGGAVPGNPGPASPASGQGWAWFGGVTGGSGTQTQAISQTVSVPAAASATLEFQLGILRADLGASADSLSILIDTTVVFTATNPQAADYLGYPLVRLSVPQFADGGLHTLVVRAETRADGPITNFSLDNIALCAPGHYPNYLPIIGR